MGTQAARADIVSKTVNTVGPGEYEDRNQFGQDTKAVTIGEKHEKRTVETVGPGAYSPERADSITRVQTENITMGKSKISRGNFLKTSDNTIGPGQYEGT